MPGADRGGDDSLLFNSLEFLVFLPTVYLLYLMGHRRQNRMLLVASYVFYGAWDERFLFLIVLSTAVDYCAGLMIEEGRVARVPGGGVGLRRPVGFRLDHSRLERGRSEGRERLALDRLGRAAFDPAGLVDAARHAGRLTVAHLLYPRLRDLDAPAAGASS